ncbi:uncharacterized protein LOC126900101 [Daktulosphaira vitifoliae]|uniref:uncharacterized protein LOC126900101 n=1 Tax=Daktulosphaira vitifoliae TaxID=58002 RepID=UPI0021AA3D13|nr:uncharacterized protein LOC126900101 [Daktulosphaira vitifoliae]
MYEWIGHVLRHGGLLGLIIEGCVEGKNARGRPRMEYMQQIIEDQGCTSYEETKRKASKTENALKKLKAVKYKKLPHPTTFKHSLGNQLGSIVVDYLDKGLVARLWTEYTSGNLVPVEFGLSPKNTFNEHIVLTVPHDVEKQALTSNAILSVGQDLEKIVLDRHKEHYKQILEEEIESVKRHHEHLAREQLNEVYREMQAACDEKKSSLLKYVNQAFIEAAKETERRVQEECKVQLAHVESRVTEQMTKRFKAWENQREEELEAHFKCNFKWAQSAQREYFIEKLNTIIEMSTKKQEQLIEASKVELKRILVTLEAEHVENLHDIDYCNLIANKTSVSDHGVISSLNSPDDSLLTIKTEDALNSHYMQIIAVENLLKEKCQLLKKLKLNLHTILKDYTEFLKTSLLEKHPHMTNTLLDQVKLLKKQLISIGTYQIVPKQMKYLRSIIK